MTGLDEATTTVDEAFAALYREHRSYVYRLALRYGGGVTPWAEDLVHDAFLKLYRQLKEGEPDNVPAWLYRVTANLAVSRSRHESSLLARMKRWAQGRGTGVEESPEAPLIRRQRAERAMASLRDLPAQQRVIVCMRILDDKSQREIAEVLSLSEGYVSKLYARARQALGEAGWEDDDGEA